MTAAEAKAAHDKQYLTQLKSGGKTYHVYVYRLVRFGAMETLVILWQQLNHTELLDEKLVRVVQTDSLVKKSRS